ncbi:PHP-associated domain-containing protein [Halovivax sp.]|uniref:PHP-associated domain-containing protein n=1 Tax=Halovivax sp. TaxID=1935978 RepID=UPI0025C67B1C|nr:PHP-associated domain-containing protein [Halovivax sp.]
MRDEYRVDLHVKVLDERVVRRAKRAGLDAIVYAPHFTPLPEIEARAARYADDELAVLPAREVFTGTWRNRQHVLALGLSEPVPDFIGLAGAMDEFDRQDAVVLAPHPEFATVSLAESELRTYRDRIHAIEVFNPKHLPPHNRRARELADELAYPPFASSYAHLTGSVGVAYTAFDPEVAAPEELLAALRNRGPRRVVHRNGFRRVRTTAAELGHLCWENSWEKVDRLLLSGTEATHPSRAIYDGRFDDVAVY